MTLILARASWRFTIEVSDRLVTQDRKSFDPIANKNIVYVAPDGVLAFGYTGLAYLEGVPTDQWLAQKLIGRVFPRGERPPAFQIGRLPYWLPVGPAIRMLTAELEKAFSASAMAADAREMFEVLGTGWQWSRRGRCRPVLLGISKARGSRSFEPWRTPRHFDRRYRFAAIPDSNAQLLDNVKLEGDHRQVRTADDAERVLVEAIRGVAAKSPYVGPNCMSIVLPPPGLRWARVRYIGVEQATIVFGPPKEANQSWTLPAAFSPWVIGRNAVHGPSVLSGSHTLSLGDFQVVLEAPRAPGPGVRGAMGSLRRPLGPR